MLQTWPVSFAVGLAVWRPPFRPVCFAWIVQFAKKRSKEDIRIDNDGWVIRIRERRW